MLGIAMFIAGPGLIRDPRPLHRWIFPLGAVIGVRLAVRKGGTARWTALLASLVLWELFMWPCLEWTPFEKSPGVWYVWNLLILLGGWSVLVWRAMQKLEGGALSMEALPLTLIALFVADLMLFVVAGLMNRFVSFWYSWVPSHPIYVMSIWGGVFALMLVGGLGSMAALAGRLDVRWGNACMSAGLMGMGTAGVAFLVDSYGPAWLDFWMDVAFWFVIQLAWFAWWGQRLARQEEA
jgi:hypothetical protein